MTNPEFSIVVPVYNSSSFLKSLVTEITEVFVAINKSYEIILVNDYSVDNSLQLMRDAKKETYLPMIIIDLKKNIGQYATTIVGLSVAKGNYIITMDADFCPEPLHIKTLIENISSGEEIIYGKFNENKKKYFRSVGSLLFDTLVKRFLNKKVTETGSSFRLISKSLSDKVLTSICEPQLLDVKLINRATRISFIPISINRMYKSSYSNIKLVMSCVSFLEGIILEGLHFRKTFIPESLIKNLEI